MAEPKVNIPTALTHITKTWSPNLIASLNSAYDIKIAKIAGEFVWHAHPDTDEFFYCLSGSLTIEMEKPHEEVDMKVGDVFVVPRGVRHRPVSEGAEIMLIEKVGTVNTGDEADGNPEMTNAVEDVRDKIGR
jgi:mannose-6-phosphate isomerase-like protein (cupin superfamily)